MKGVSLRLILEDKDKGGYQFVGFNLGFEIFSGKREHHKKGLLKQKIEASLYTLHWDFKIIPSTLYTYALAKYYKTVQNLYKKTDSWFKKLHREFGQIQAHSRKS